MQSLYIILHKRFSYGHEFLLTMKKLLGAFQN